MVHSLKAKPTEAEAWLLVRNVPFRRTSAYHIKIGHNVSYWPSTGRIYLDGASKRHPHHGLAALAAVLQEEGYRPDPDTPILPTLPGTKP